MTTTPIQIITNKQQLQFVQKCIQLAKKHCPEELTEKDELDNDLGELLFDMMKMFLLKITILKLSMDSFIN